MAGAFRPERRRGLSSFIYYKRWGVILGVALLGVAPAYSRIVAPVITQQPVSRTNNAGTTATFAVSATGTTPKYRWVKNGTFPLRDGGKISGSATPVLTLSNVLGADRGTYAAFLSNLAGLVASSNATLKVIDPVITSQPASRTNSPGTPAAFAVGAAGTPPKYQWRKNLSVIPGATAQTYSIASVAGADAGGYSVVITNAFGTVTSAPPAQLTVAALVTSDAITSSANPSGFKDRVSFTVSLPAAATGTVGFSANGGLFDTETLSQGQATSVGITSLPRGTIPITVAYAGDLIYSGVTNTLVQTVTNHPPVAAPMTVYQTAGVPLLLSLAEVATNWSDADGDGVTLGAFNPVTTNGVSLLTNTAPFVDPTFAVTNNPASSLATNEVWIATNPATANLGTLSAPYDGSTQVKFDALWARIPPYTTIHILPGTYQTRGGSAWLIQSGQRLLGSGMDVTVLQLLGGDSTYFVLQSIDTSANIEVADLTLDANGSLGAAFSHSGIILGGTHHAIRRVKVINCVAGGTIAEVWGIVIESYSLLGPSEGNIIEGCEVSHHQGPIYTNGYATDLYAIVLNGGTSSPITGMIRNNRVIAVPGKAVGGIGLGRAHDCLVISNYVEGNGSGTHIEGPDSITNTIFAYNIYKGITQVIDMSNDHPVNIAYLYNNIELSNNLYNFVIAFGFPPSGSYTNIVIYGNEIKCASSFASWANMLVYGCNLSGLLVANNKIDSRLTNFLSNCSDVTMFGNTDLSGNEATGLNLSASAPSLATTFGLADFGVWIFSPNGNGTTDQLRYPISDGQGGTGIGLINIIMDPPPLFGDSALAVSGGTARLLSHGLAGYSYITERTTNLASPLWVAIATNTAANNGTISVVDQFSDLGGPPAAAFYRLKWTP